MHILKKPIEQPYAFAHRKGFAGKAPGLYYHYYETREKAERGIAWCEKHGKWHGPIEYRPGESRIIGHM